MADPAVDVGPLVESLLAPRAPGGTPEETFGHVCRGLAACGIGVYRIGLFVRTLHPNVAGRAFFWRADRETVEVDDASHGWFASDQHLQSPLHTIWTRFIEVRRRLCDPDCPMDYPVLAELREEGATDYLAVPLWFLSGEVHAVSFATRRPGGFAAAELAGLRKVLPYLARVVEIFGLMRKARNILDAYLGPSAGEKVLAGQIRRGDGQDIDAVIWFCDLRDSTPLANALGRREFLALLNEYFECMLEPVLEQKGEVLRFIGDAALAIFPVDGRPAEACAKALAAAEEALRRIERLNQGRPRPLRIGIGLHMGELTYGNIGTPSRIEFTVIGAAANEAARIESLCKELGADLLVSERVARALTGPAWRSLGRHTLRGVGDKMEIYTLP